MLGFALGCGVSHGVSPPPSAGDWGPIGLPAWFDRPAPYAMTRLPGGEIATDFDVLSLVPSIDVMYYWDPVSGNDGNDGLSPATPKRNFSAVLVMAPSGAATIGITPIVNAHINLFSSAGWLNNVPTRNVVVRNTSGYRINMVNASGTAPTWSANGTYPGIFEATTSAPGAVVDLTVWTQPSIVVPLGKALKVDGIWRIGDGLTPITLQNVPPVAGVARKVASLQAVNDAPNAAWYHDGTKLYAKASDGRSLIGSTTFRPTVAGVNGRFGTQNNQTIFLEGLNFIGGGIGFLAGSASTVTGQALIANRCSFQATGSGNGLSVQSRCRTYVYRCGAYNNWTDGFNYHSFESDGTTLGTSPEIDEIECVAFGNGTWGSTGGSDNDTTAHDDVRVRRINGLYLGSDDRVMVDVNKSKSWNLGCFIAQPVTPISTSQPVTALDTAVVGLDSCVIGSGGTGEINVQSTAQAYYARMALPANAGLGPLAQYGM